MARMAPATTLSFSLTVDFGDAAGAGSFHFVLHFHGFHDNDAVSGIHFIANRDEDAHDFAGHGRENLGATVAARVRAERFHWRGSSIVQVKRRFPNG